MSRPRILIPIPTSFDHAYNEKSWPEYAAAVQVAGGEPIEVPLTHRSSELEALARSSEGILLPGSGADVDPSRYGHERDPNCAEADPLRENTDRALLEIAEKTGLPVLGICLGLQSINVFYGGTLFQDLAPMPVNHRAGRGVAVAHTTLISRASRLGAALSGLEDDDAPDTSLARVLVNSSHHQAVAIPGTGLRIAARCPDDQVIEALEGDLPDHWMLGVQWHPERTYDLSEGSRKIFHAFVKAAGEQ